MYGQVCVLKQGVMEITNQSTTSKMMAKIMAKVRGGRPAAARPAKPTKGRPVTKKALKAAKDEDRIRRLAAFYATQDREAAAAPEAKAKSLLTPELRAHLEEQGYVVIPGVLTPEQVAAHLRQWEHDVRTWTNGAVDITDPKTFRDWNSKYSLSHKMLVQSEGSGYAPTAWAVRDEPAIAEVFADLHQVRVDQLRMNPDALALFLPSTASDGDGAAGAGVGAGAMDDGEEEGEDDADTDDTGATGDNGDTGGTATGRPRLPKGTVMGERRKKWHHSDTGPDFVDQFCVQGQVPLVTQRADGGTLVVLARSHKLTAEYFDTMGPAHGIPTAAQLAAMEAELAAGTGTVTAADVAKAKEVRAKDWHMVFPAPGATKGGNDIDWFLARGCEEVCIEAPAGSLVLWDSRTIHCGLPATREALTDVYYGTRAWQDYIRATFYVCAVPMVPGLGDGGEHKYMDMARADLDARETVAKALTRGEVVSHNPWRPRAFAKMPYNYGAPLTRRVPFPGLTPESFAALSAHVQMLVGGPLGQELVEEAYADMMKLKDTRAATVAKKKALLSGTVAGSAV